MITNRASQNKMGCGRLKNRITPDDSQANFRNIKRSARSQFDLSQKSESFCARTTGMLTDGRRITKLECEIRVCTYSASAKVSAKSVPSAHCGGDGVTLNAQASCLIRSVGDGPRRQPARELLVQTETVDNDAKAGGRDQ